MANSPLKKVYNKQIKRGVERILEIYKSGNRPFNARMQEGVLSLALNDPKKHTALIEKQIEYWTRLQHKDGSFPEYTKNERSLSATAFSTAAIALTIKELKLENRKFNESLEKAGRWLSKNDELILINQEAGAALALITLYGITKNSFYKEQAKSKLKKVLELQKGYYPEKKGFDLGYSSVTLQILAQYHSIEKDASIISSARSFINFLHGSMQEKNSRDSDWLTMGGFEYFNKYVPETKELFPRIMERKDILNIHDDRHLCTDLYRLIFAHKHESLNIKISKPIPKSRRFSKVDKKIYNPLRRFGLHKLRWLVN